MLKPHINWRLASYLWLGFPINMNNEGDPRLCIQDVDFGQNKIFVRSGKGGKDRATILPRNVREKLQVTP